MWQLSSFWYRFKLECRSGGNKLANVRRFFLNFEIGRGLLKPLSIYNKLNHVNFSGKKNTMKLSVVVDSLRI